jgi:hypothetical protein
MQTINNAIISVLFSKDKYYSGFELLSALVTTAVCRGSKVSQNPLWRLLKDNLKQERKTHSKFKNSNVSVGKYAWNCSHTVRSTLTPNKLLTKKTRALEKLWNHGCLLLVIMQTISQSHSRNNTMSSFNANNCISCIH